MHIAFAVTAHGLGHWGRSAALIASLLEHDRKPSVSVSTGLSKAVVKGSFPGLFESRVRHRLADYEPGVAQNNCIDIDAPGTVDLYRKFHDDRERRLEDERAFLTRDRVDLVISDVPAIAVRAAADVGIPAVGVASFTWDWILEPMLRGTRAEPVLDALRRDYGVGSKHFLLPFGCSCSPFPAVEAAPLLCRNASLGRGEARQALGLPRLSSRPLLLICMGGWSGENLPAIRVRNTSDLDTVIIGGLGIATDGPTIRLTHDLPGGLSVPDLIHAADLLVTKPGYGMAAEAYVHGTPVAFVERLHFAETRALMSAMADHPIATLSRQEFEQGTWERAFADLLGQRVPRRSNDGARQIADAILTTYR